MEDLFVVIYDELRELAGKYVRRNADVITFCPTELVHEAYLKLQKQDRVSWQGKTHFLAVSALVMKRLMLDIIRNRKSMKRGGSWDRITFDRVLDKGCEERLDVDLIEALYEALEKLAKVDEREAKVVELRIFGGMTVAEVAEHLGVAPRTVSSDWTHARAWLRRELNAEGGNSG